MSVPTNLLSANTSSMETDISGWSAGTATTIASNTTKSWDGVKSLQMTRTGSTGAASSTTVTRVAVTAGREYTAEAYFSLVVAATGRTATVAVSWWAVSTGGTAISTTTSPAITLPNATDWSRPPAILVATAPAGAAFASVTVSVAGMTASSAVAVDSVAFGLAPVLVGNLLPYNVQGIEQDGSGWAAAGNCSIVRSTANQWEGWCSLTITSTAAGDTQARTAAMYPVTAGTDYYGYAMITPPAGRTFVVEMQWYDGSGVLLSSSSQSWPSLAAVWTRVTVIGTAPAGASQARLALRPLATAAAQVWSCDEMFIGRAPSPNAGNLLTYNESSFEVDTSGWTLSGGATMTLDGTASWDGWSQLQITADGTSDPQLTLARDLPITAGQAYQWSPIIILDRVDRGYTLRLQWLDSGGQVLRTRDGDWTVTPDLVDEYSTASTADLAPVGAVALRPSIILTSSESGDITYLDDLLVGPGGLAAAATELAGQFGARILLQGLTTGSTDRWGLWRVQPDGSLAPVRGSGGDLTDVITTGATAIVDDYEAPLGVPVQWVVQTWWSDDPDGLFTYTTDPIILAIPPAQFIVLKDPGQPARNMTVMGKLAPDWSRKARQGRYEPRGRVRPIIRSDVRGTREGTLEVWTRDDTERRRLDWLLDPGSILMLQVPPGTGFDRDMYVSVGDTDEQRPVPLVYDTLRSWPLPLVEVDRPIGGIIGSGTRTCQTVLDEAATCLALMNMYATGLGVLTGIQGT